MAQPCKILTSGDVHGRRRFVFPGARSPTYSPVRAVEQPVTASVPARGSTANPCSSQGLLVLVEPPRAALRVPAAWSPPCPWSGRTARRGPNHLHSYERGYPRCITTLIRMNVESPENGHPGRVGGLRRGHRLDQLGDPRSRKIDRAGDVLGRQPRCRSSRIDPIQLFSAALPMPPVWRPLSRARHPGPSMRDIGRCFVRPHTHMIIRRSANRHAATSGRARSRSTFPGLEMPQAHPRRLPGEAADDDVELAAGAAPRR
jgi:hypothetical protein